MRKLSALKVLVVDDQKNMVKTIENMLTAICSFKRKSSSLLRANDGEEALNILLNQQPGLKGHIDLVLLDWNMPKVPGIDVVRGIRKSELKFVKDLPVIMITGESLAKDVNNALYEGVDNYLLKPFLMDDMRSRMNPILRHYWSGIKMRRAQNRRSEVRYFVDRLKLAVEVEFLDGTVKKAQAVNISGHGIRLLMETPEKFEIKGLRFPTMTMVNGFENFVDAVGFLPEFAGKPEKIQMSMWFKFGFPDEAIGTRWLEWLDAAREKELEYRSQMV